jgi:hypothetical protein
MPLDFKDLLEPNKTDFIRVPDEAKDRVNRAMVVVYEKTQLVVCYSANSWVKELIVECGGGPDTFDAGRMNVDSDVPLEDGVYICDIKVEDDGPGDWPGSREVIPALRKPRRATKEEWAAHCRGEWPWDLVEKEAET